MPSQWFSVCFICVIVKWHNYLPFHSTFYKKIKFDFQLIGYVINCVRCGIIRAGTVHSMSSGFFSRQEAVVKACQSV